MDSVFGIGNPLMDYLFHVDPAVLAQLGAAPGGMELVASERSAVIRSDLGDAYTLPGGSCANTMRGLAWLASDGVGVTPHYTGVVGRDAQGDAYEQSLMRSGVVSALRRETGDTGASVVLITPDGERTMFTSLGVSLLLREEHLDTAVLAKAAAFYATGYLFDGSTELATLDFAVARAAEADVPVVFDVADPFVVARNRDQLLEWLPGKAAVLLGNRSELRMLIGAADDDAAIEGALGLVPTVVMKVGSEGAKVRQAGQLAAAWVESVAVPAVDTTGAGDSFAAGFLHRWLAGGDPVAACELGNRVAAQIVVVEGCDYSAADRSTL